MKLTKLRSREVTLTVFTLAVTSLGLSGANQETGAWFTDYAVVSNSMAFRVAPPSLYAPAYLPLDENQSEDALEESHYVSYGDLTTYPEGESTQYYPAFESDYSSVGDEEEQGLPIDNPDAETQDGESIELVAIESPEPEPQSEEAQVVELPVEEQEYAY
ncbi:MAG: hypothetical protein FWF59_03680 [Turicibacter sp.]|nr:hypothetical protein [Turicibacter sp.]